METIYEEFMVFFVTISKFKCVFEFRFWFFGLKYVESWREPTARFYTKNKFGNRGFKLFLIQKMISYCSTVLRHKVTMVDLHTMINP